jgi:ElaB/YqjD/DUF883 family membrane-anchored ribosome-binding protein
MSSQQDLIRRQIDRTTMDLEENIHQLGAIVEGTYVSAKDSVNEVKNAVTQTIQSLSPEYQIRQRPWTSVGVAVGGGFLLGKMAVGKGGDANPRPAGRDSQPEPSRRSRLLDQFAPEIDYIKAAILTSAIGYLAERIKAKKPELAAHVSELESQLKGRFGPGSRH